MNVPGISDSVAAIPEQTKSLQSEDQQESIKTDKMDSDPQGTLYEIASLQAVVYSKSRLEPLVSKSNVWYENKQTHPSVTQKKSPCQVFTIISDGFSINGRLYFTAADFKAVILTPL